MRSVKSTMRSPIWHTIVVTVSIIGFFENKASAATDCDSVLITSTYSQVSQSTSSLSLLKLLNEDTYSTTRHSGQSGSSDSGNVFTDFGFGGVNVNQFNSYNDFNQWRNSYLSQQKYNLSESDSRSYLATFIPPELATAWLTCKTQEALINKQGTVLLAVKDKSDTSLSIEISWYPPPGGGSATLEYQLYGLNNAKIPGAPKTLSANSTEGFSVTLVPNKEFRLIVNANKGFTDQIYIPAQPPLPLKTEKTLKERHDSAAWINIDPRVEGEQTVGIINAGDVKLVDAAGRWFCAVLPGDPSKPALPSHPGDTVCTHPYPVEGFLHLDFQPTDGRPPESSTFSHIFLLVGPGVLKARIDDSVYNDNGWPGYPALYGNGGDPPRVALY